MNDTQANDNINGYAMSPEEPRSTIARLRRKLENFQLIIESQDQREMEVMTRSEGDAALIDALQQEAALHRDALNVYREELRVFPSDVAGFCAVLHNRKVAMGVALNDLLVFVERYNQIPEATQNAIEAVMMRLAHLKLANSGEVTKLSTMPDGGDINEINAWVERTKAEEKERAKYEELKKGPTPRPTPVMLAWCSQCNRHVAPEDRVTRSNQRGDYPAHRDCGTKLEYHKEDRTRTDMHGHEVTIPPVEEEWMAKAEDDLKRRLKEFREYCRRTNEKLSEMKEPDIKPEEVEAVTGIMNNGGLPLYCADCIRERRHAF